MRYNGYLGGGGGQVLSNCKQRDLRICSIPLCEAQSACIAC